MLSYKTNVGEKIKQRIIFSEKLCQLMSSHHGDEAKDEAAEEIEHHVEILRRRRDCPWIKQPLLTKIS